MRRALGVPPLRRFPRSREGLGGSRFGATALVAAAVMLLAGGCMQENAVLELYLTLPPAPAGGPGYALVQARRADEVSFAVPDWLDSNDLPAVALTNAEHVDHVSIETVGVDDFDLDVRVRWCESVGCSDPADDPSMGPQTCLTLQHPFYLGHRTSYHTDPLSIADASMGPCPPADVMQVDHCAIEGCAAVPDSSTHPSFCRMDGTHLCQ